MAGALRSQPLSTSFPVPALPRGRAKKPLPGHAIHTCLAKGMLPAGPRWEATERSGWQDTGGLARVTAAEENPPSTCPHHSALQHPPHSHRALSPKQMLLQTNIHVKRPQGCFRRFPHGKLSPGAAAGSSTERAALLLPSSCPLLEGHLHAPASWVPMPGGPSSSPTRAASSAALLPAWAPPPSLPPSSSADFSQVRCHMVPVKPHIFSCRLKRHTFLRARQFTDCSVGSISYWISQKN